MYDKLSNHLRNNHPEIKEDMKKLKPEIKRQEYSNLNKKGDFTYFKKYLKMGIDHMIPG